MRIFATILSMFLLLPGLCGSIFLPLSFGSRGDPYVEVVYWLSGIGLAAGIIGVVILFFTLQRVPKGSRRNIWPIIGYLILGMVGAALVVPALTSIVYLFTSIVGSVYAIFTGQLDQVHEYLFPVFGQSLLSLAAGFGGAWLVFFAAKRIVGDKMTAGPNAPPSSTDEDSA